MSSSKSILIIGYNRPQLLKKLLTKLLQFPGNHIFISIDGPKLEKRDDQELVSKSRSLVLLFQKKYLGNVEIKFNEQNLGCKYGVTSAIDWFFNSVEHGIILEDDLDMSENFLDYSSYLLSVYKDNPKIFSFSGNNFSQTFNGGNNLVFSLIPHVWGWGTWKDRWKLYDGDLICWNPRKWPKWFSESPNLSRYQKRTIANLFNRIHTNKVDTWDYQLLYASLKFNFLNIHPPANLVKNVGFDKNATHTRFNVINPRLNFEPFKINDLKFVEPIRTAPYDTEYLKQSKFYYKLLFLLRNFRGG